MNCVLHIQDATYKLSPTLFSSRPGGYNGSIDRKNCTLLRKFEYPYNFEQGTKRWVSLLISLFLLSQPDEFVITSLALGQLDSVQGEMINRTKGLHRIFSLIIPNENFSPIKKILVCLTASKNQLRTIKQLFFHFLHVIRYVQFGLHY